MLVALTINGFLPFQEMCEGLVASSNGDSMHMPWVCVSEMHFLQCIVEVGRIRSGTDLHVTAPTLPVI